MLAHLPHLCPLKVIPIMKSLLQSTPLLVELSDGIQVPPETINSRDAGSCILFPILSPSRLLSSINTCYFSFHSSADLASKVVLEALSYVQQVCSICRLQAVEIPARW
jgi:hypothetical protein